LKTVNILEHYGKYMMFSVKTEGQKNYLIKFFNKLKLKFDIKGFREPNMDEAFLGVRVHE